MPVNQGSQEIYLGDGQILSGRSADFRASATVANRPAITGGLWWKGNGRFQDINITNNGQVNTIDSSVAALGAAGNLNIKNALISANAKGHDVNAIESYNNLVLSNSSVSANGDNFLVAASALNALTVNNSQITAFDIAAVVF